MHACHLLSLVTTTKYCVLTAYYGVHSVRTQLPSTKEADPRPGVKAVRRILHSSLYNQQSKKGAFLTVINYVHLLLHHVPSTFKEFVNATSWTENLGSTEKLPWPMIGRSRDLVTVRQYRWTCGRSTDHSSRRQLTWQSRICDFSRVLREFFDMLYPVEV